MTGLPLSARTRRRIGDAATYLAALVVAAVILAPFAWLFITSVASGADLLRVPLDWWPDTATFDRFRAIITSTLPGDPAFTFRRSLSNSLQVAGYTTLLSMGVGVPAAYVLARYRFRGSATLSSMFLSSYMLPPIALIVSIFIIMSRLELRDTTIGLALVYSSFVTPYVVWIMRGYFRSIPDELEQAARVDGCSRMGAFFRIALPLARPGLATTVIFAVLTAWDEFLYALVLTSSLEAKTIPVAIAEFTGQHQIDFGMIATGGVIAALPPVLLALLLQRYVIRGLTAGGLRG